MVICRSNRRVSLFYDEFCSCNIDFSEECVLCSFVQRRVTTEYHNNATKAAKETLLVPITKESHMWYMWCILGCLYSLYDSILRHPAWFKRLPTYLQGIQKEYSKWGFVYLLQKESDAVRWGLVRSEALCSTGMWSVAGSCIQTQFTFIDWLEIWWILVLSLDFFFPEDLEQYSS